MKRFIVMTLLISCLVFLPVVSHAAYVTPVTNQELFDIVYGSDGLFNSTANVKKTLVLAQYSEDNPGLVQYLVYSWAYYSNIPGLELVHDGNNLNLVVSNEDLAEGSKIFLDYDTLRIHDGEWGKTGNSKTFIGPKAVGDVVMTFPDSDYDIVFSYDARNNNSGDLVEIPVLNSDGTIFFPPGQTLAEAIVEGLAEMQAMTGGTMMTLTACGVGLVASLMALKVFSKASVLFLH